METAADEARELMQRLRAEGRTGDAMILRRLLQSHVGQANTLRDQALILKSHRVARAFAAPQRAAARCLT